MSANARGVSLRKSSPEPTGEEHYNLTTWKLVLFALLDSPCQLLLAGEGFYPGNEISL